MKKTSHREKFNHGFLLTAYGIFVLLMTACKDKIPTESRFSSGDRVLILAARYPAKVIENLIFFGFHYPSMVPTQLDDAPAYDQIDVYVSRIGGPERTWTGFNQPWQKSTGAQYDPKNPGRAYQGGQQGPYQIYFFGAPEDIKKTIYLFRAHDDELVRVDVPGDWSYMSHAYRT